MNDKDKDINKELKYPLSRAILLKHKECASIIGQAIYKGEFYLCSSMAKPNYTICKHCVEKCHEGHVHTLLSKGSYQCLCADNRHVCKVIIKEENAKNCYYQDLFKETPNEGFFYHKSNNAKEKTLTFCAICTEKCNIQPFDGGFIIEKVTKKEDEICECPNHKARNAYLISQDFKNKNKSTNKSNKKFTSYLKNFNFNIMLKNPNVSVVTQTVLENALAMKKINIGEALIESVESEAQIERDPKDYENEIDALTDPNTQAVLELFGVFSFKWKNKFFYCKRFKDIFDPAIVLIKQNNNLTAPKDEQYTRFKNQLKWINLLFSMYIRKDYIDNNNLWSLNTIQNMNINQRFKYIIKESYKDTKSKANETEAQKRASQIITLLLDLFEKIMNDSHSSDDDIKIYEELFPYLNKMMKFSIKFQIADDKQSMKYFLLVKDMLGKYKDDELEKEEKIKLVNKKENARKEKELRESQIKKQHGVAFIETGILKTCNTKLLGNIDKIEHTKIMHSLETKFIEDNQDNKSTNEHYHTQNSTLGVDDPYQIYLKSHLLIIKSIFYYLLYRNDCLVKKQLDQNDKNDNYEFIFTEQTHIYHQEVMQAIKTIFYTIISEPLASCEKEDLSIQSIESKIFNLMTKNDFYVKSLKNLNLIYEENHNTKTIKTTMTKEIQDIVVKFRGKAREYFTYDVKYKEYAIAIDDIMINLQRVVEKNVQLKDLSDDYLNFIKDDGSQEMKDKLRALQEAVKDTTLFQAFEEIIHICGMAAEFVHPEIDTKSELEIMQTVENNTVDNMITMSPSSNTRKFMLQLYYLLMENNHENLCLFMNLKAKPFVVFFNYISEDYFNFYYRFIEILYSSPYYFANNQFIKETLISFVHDVIRQKKDINRVIKYSSALFKMFNLLLRKDATQNVIDLGSSYSKLFPIKKLDNLKRKFNAYLTIEDDGIKDPLRDDTEYKNDVANALMNLSDLAGTLESLDIKKFIPITADSPENLIPYQNIPNIIKDFISKPKDKRTIDVKVIYPLLKYFINKTLPFNIHIAESDRLIACSFHQLSDNPESNEDIAIKKGPTRRGNRVERDQILSNVSLMNICRDFSGPNSKTGNINTQISKLFELFDFLSFLAKNFDIILLAYINSENSFKSIFEMKLVLYQLLQNIFIKPLYYYIKVLEIYLPFIEGAKFEVLHRCAFEVLRAIHIFYKNINDKKIIYKKTNDNMNIKAKKYDDLFTDPDFMNYIQLDIKRKMGEFDMMALITSEVINIASSKFFQVKQYIEKLENCLRHIIIFDQLDSNETKPKVKNLMIETVIENYLFAMDKGSQFLVFPSKISVGKILSCNYFTKKVIPLEIVDIEKIEYFINIMKSISDIKYVIKLEQKEEIAIKLKKYTNKQLIDNFLKLICFTNIVEMTKMFHLFSMKNKYETNLNAFINQTLTMFFQILCEGNNIVMKEYLFMQNMPIIIDITTGNNCFNLKETNKGSNKDKEQDKAKGKEQGQGEDKDNEQDKSKEQVKDKGDNKDDNNKQVKDKEDISIKTESETKHQKQVTIMNLKPQALLKQKSKSKMKKASLILMNKEDTSSEKFDPNLKNTHTFASVTQEVVDVKRSKKTEEYAKHNLEKLKTQGNFFNVICTNMKMVFLKCKENQNKNLCLTQQIYNQTKDIIYLNPNNLNIGYTNLLIEMIQGYNFKEDIFSNDSNNEPLHAFFYLCKEINSIMINIQTSLDLTLIDYKINLFTIVVNILNQKYDFKKAKFLNNFDVMKLMNLLAFYIKNLYERFCLKEVKTNNNIIFTYPMLKKFIAKYKNDHDIYNDKIFKLSNKIYMFLRILKDKHRNQMLVKSMGDLSDTFDERINKLMSTFQGAHQSNSEKDKDKEEKRKEQENKLEVDKTITVENKRMDHDKTKESNKVSNSESNPRLNQQRNISNRIFAFLFFEKIIKTIEICIPIDNNRRHNKNVLYLIQPSTYLFNDKELEKCISNVDRSSRRTKLTSIIDLLPDIIQKINYKDEIASTSETTMISQWFNNFNYAHIDLFNCIFAIIINCTFLGLLDRNQTSLVILGNISFYMELVLIAVNLFALGVYLNTKFLSNGYLLWEKIDKKDKNFLRLAKVYLYDAFLHNDDIKTMILITIFGILGISTKYDIILFTLQLFTIGTFIPTIQEIIYAFKMRYDQLVSMVFFLAIFTFFFANYDYYFLKDQFLLETDTGEILNSCSTLLECYLTLFNNGVRSGGGIGDVLRESSYTTPGYYERWIHDAIFFLVVILLLLNMINGVIVTTFGQLREESTAKEEDMNTTCFICQIPAFELEKQNKTLKNHFRNEHNLKCYVRYLISLFLMKDSEMDQDQYYVFNCINDKAIDFFPFYKNDNDGENEEEENE